MPPRLAPYAFARNLRRNPTDAERALWHLIRRKQIGGLHFRRQVVIGRYVADFVCLTARLIVEVDGSQHADAEHYDAARAHWLEEQGFKVIRFWNRDVFGDPNGVIERIQSAAAAGTAQPSRYTHRASRISSAPPPLLRQRPEDS